MSILRSILVPVAAVIPLAVTQAGTDPVLQRLSVVPDPQARLEQMASASLDLFHQALHEYDVQLERAPFDIMAQLARCQFMADFADSNEEAAYVDDVYEEAATCRDAVAEKFPGHPEIQLLELEELPLDQRLTAGAAALERSGGQNWTSGQLSRLNVLLAVAADKKDGNRSIEFARQALRYDERADVRELLASKLLAAGRKQEAIEVLTSPTDPHAATDSWYHAERLKMLAQAGAPRDVVLPIYKIMWGQQDYNHLQAARVLMRVGAIDEARREFAAMAKGGTRFPAALWEHFRFEFDNGSAQEALTAYNRWRDTGWINDPLGINRFALLSRSIGLPWKARDLLGVGGLLLTLLATAAFVLVPISMVHYRGLARRVHTMDPYPRTGWQLRHAWLALSLFGIAQVLALYGAGPIELRALAKSAADMGERSHQLARISIVSALLVIVLLLPLAAISRRVWSRWSVRYWSIGKALLIGGLIGVAFRLPLIFTALTAGPMNGSTTQEALWMVLKGMRDEFGIASALWFVGVSAPVIEEFVFRGVMLNALASHIRFRWANVIQALLFAAMHMDAKAAAPLFIFGLVSAGLAKRSGGLLASMTMHAVFNLIGTTVMLGGK